MIETITPKKTCGFYCEDCDFKCSNKKDYKRHLATMKHMILTNTDIIYPKNPKTNHKFICECGKSYKHRQTLHAHKKKCKHKEPSSETEILTGPTMEYLLKENLEMKKDNLEMKKGILEAQKNTKEFYCENCDFACSKESNYKVHLNTRKHQIATTATKKVPKNATYLCECGKKYKDRTGLWRHKKKCIYKEHSQDTEITI